MTSAADPPIRGTAPARPLRGPSRLLRRIAGELAAERVLRVLAFGFLPAAVVFGLLATPTLAAQSGSFPLWWDEAAFGGVVAPCVLLGSLAFTVPVWVLRCLAGVAMVATLLVQATIPLVVQAPIPGDAPPWFDQIGSLGTIAAVLAVAPPVAVLVVLGSGALTFLGRVATDVQDGALDGVQNGLYVMLFSLTFVALGASSIAAARSADVAEADALRAATDAAADAARERERARINALVHDRVLATLLTAARRIPGSATHEREDARRALEGLQALLEDQEAALEAPSGEQLAWQIQAVTTDLVPEAVFGYDIGADLRIDPDAAEALSDAAEEAIRNSLKHSAAENRAVHVEVDGDGVRIDVLDDGIGFDRDRVPGARLGLTESIEGRMQGVAGGSAVIVSAEGVGTRVQLRWRPS